MKFTDEFSAVAMRFLHRVEYRVDIRRGGEWIYDACAQPEGVGNGCARQKSRAPQLQHLKYSAIVGVHFHGSAAEFGRNRTETDDAEASRFPQHEIIG